MLARTLMNLLAVAMVAGGMARAWRATHSSKLQSSKNKRDESAPREVESNQPWGLLRNEAEIERRRAYSGESTC